MRGAGVFFLAKAEFTIVAAPDTGSRQLELLGKPSVGRRVIISNHVVGPILTRLAGRIQDLVFHLSIRL